jgi:hypothetical protein
MTGDEILGRIPLPPFRFVRWPSASQVSVWSAAPGVAGQVLPLAYRRHVVLPSAS